MNHDNLFQPEIQVVGCGGGGGNAVLNMLRNSVPGVNLCMANTDAQTLHAQDGVQTLHLGNRLTGGLGAGGNPAVGREAAVESKEEIHRAVQNADLVFVTAGMGGGTGTGSAPVVAEIARAEGALVVGVVTSPFKFEGRRRARQAELGIEALENATDTLLVIPNEQLLTANPMLSMDNAFEYADQILCQGVRGISDLMVQTGLINLDFNDLRTVLSSQGRGLMATGRASGPKRTVEAVMQAIDSPLLERNSIHGAGAILMNFAAAPGELKLQEVNEAAERIQEEAGDSEDIFFGMTEDASLEDEVSVTIIAAGIDAGTDSPAQMKMEQTAGQSGSNWPRAESYAPAMAPLLHAQQDSSHHALPPRSTLNEPARDRQRRTLSTAPAVDPQVEVEVNAPRSRPRRY